MVKLSFSHGKTTAIHHSMYPTSLSDHRDHRGLKVGYSWGEYLDQTTPFLGYIICVYMYIYICIYIYIYTYIYTICIWGYDRSMGLTDIILLVTFC